MTDPATWRRAVPAPAPTPVAASRTRPARRLSVAVVAIAVVVAAAVVAGCEPPPERPPPGRIGVVASFYPLAEATRQVGGRRVEVTDITPPGAEPHDLELSTRDVDRIEDASLVVVLGGGFQSAVDAATGRRDGPTLVVLDALAGHDGGAGAERLRPGDPHVWLDPVLMADIVRLVADRLGAVDPDHRPGYRERSAAYLRRLASLDARFRAGLAHCERRTIVTSHAAFGYLADRYGLEQRSVVGLVPDQEPDPRTLGEIADLVRRDGVTTVFTEKLASPRIAETIAREAGGARVDVLDPLETLTRDQLRGGVDYLSVMDDNLGRLRRALGCR